MEEQWHDDQQAWAEVNAERRQDTIDCLERVAAAGARREDVLRLAGELGVSDAFNP
jgi:hypothetical protein